MISPRLEAKLDKLLENTQKITNLCKQNGLEVAGVTKSVCGNPVLAREMIKGGVSVLADTRLKNIKRLKRAGLKVPLMLIRGPLKSEISGVVEWADLSFNTEPEIIRAISDHAQRKSTVHKVVLMIDIGDLREGILPANIFKVAQKIKKMPGVKVVGAGTNVGCFGGVVPTEKNMELFMNTVEKLEETLECKMDIVSGGGSNILPLVLSNKLPSRINQLRIGESILLGRNVQDGSSLLPGMHRDVFVLAGEIIELKKKPSLPYGKVDRNAFGEEPCFESNGIIFRALLALGRQDVIIDGLKPLRPEIDILGASSDHLVLKIKNADKAKYSPGKQIYLLPDYAALMTAMASPFVKKLFKMRGYS